VTKVRATFLYPDDGFLIGRLSIVGMTGGVVAMRTVGLALPAGHTALQDFARDGIEVSPDKRVGFSLRLGSAREQHGIDLE
jgi:hypothetical protein